MDSKREPYRRLKIKESEFRLLILQPGSWDHELVCDLNIASHPKDEYFEALSYTWGDAGDLRPITVNHECIGITTNLEIALRYLRKLDEPRVLWVDALCIDQEDTEEKSSQVQRMGEIFSSANSVLAWLGPPEPKSEEAMQAIEKIGFALLPILCADGGLAYCRGLSPVDLQKNMGLQLSAMNWDAIWAICERPYWHRVWIIQELFDSVLELFLRIATQLPGYGLRVGVGPKCTKPGDEVVLLFGSPLCFVLRPEGERYRLIGDAYVQDVPPELWSNDHNALDVTVKDFEIQ
ncbi:hypothetical protein E8E14_010916 [Neopestalotiopsis sp. 37M]|nr:hypothetical protein E8E14_010916 [Neopestalotiopsis sp. 37M]